MPARDFAFLLFNAPDLLKEWRNNFVEKYCECQQPTYLSTEEGLALGIKDYKPVFQREHTKDCKAFTVFLGMLSSISKQEDK